MRVSVSLPTFTGSIYALLAISFVFNLSWFSVQQPVLKYIPFILLLAVTLLNRTIYLRIALSRKSLSSWLFVLIVSIYNPLFGASLATSLATIISLYVNLRYAKLFCFSLIVTLTLWLLLVKIGSIPSDLIEIDQLGRYRYSLGFNYSTTYSYLVVSALFLSAICSSNFLMLASMFLSCVAYLETSTRLSLILSVFILAFVFLGRIRRMAPSIFLRALGNRYLQVTLIFFFVALGVISLERFAGGDFDFFISGRIVQSLSIEPTVAFFRNSPAVNDILPLNLFYFGGISLLSLFLLLYYRNALKVFSPPYLLFLLFLLSPLVDSGETNFSVLTGFFMLPYWLLPVPTNKY